MCASRKVLLVTGASRGIGAATARLAARRGYAVAINYHSNHNAAARVLADIQEVGGVAKAFAADVSDSGQVEQLFARIDREIGPISALVNNAGVSGGFVSFNEVTPELLQSVFGTTLFGAFYCIHAAIQRMARSRGGDGGAIVNVGSQAAKFGGDRLCAYAAAKAGLHTLTVSLARELAPEGIRVNAVSPGVIATDQQRGLPPQRLAGLQASLPLGRMGEPEEVAEAIMWLLSDSASYVTGAVLSVSGGR